MIVNKSTFFQEFKDYFKHQVFKTYSKKNINHDSEKVLILLPGFLTNEKPMANISQIAQNLGFNVVSLKDILVDKQFGFMWRKGFNMGWDYTVLNEINDYITKMNDNNKQVYVIGWSLGGFYSRMLTQKVHTAINITSPVKEGIGSNCAVGWLYGIITGKDIAELDLVLGLSKAMNKNKILNYVATKDAILSPDLCFNKNSVEIEASHINILTNKHLLNNIKSKLIT